MSSRVKKILISIFLFLPLLGLILIGVAAKALNPIAVTVILTCYLVVWVFLCIYIYKKIKSLNVKIMLEELSEKVLDIPTDRFIEASGEKLLKDGFEKRIDVYEDGEIKLTATCFYKAGKSSAKEIDTVLFLEGVKAFSDLINTEEELKNSFLNCLEDERQFSSVGQVIAIVSPYPEKEIFNFCVNSFYNQQNGILFVACDKEAGKAYYSSPSRKKNKNFSRSENLVKQYILIK